MKLAVLLLALLPVTAAAQRGLKNIPNPDPAVEQATFEVAEGWQVNLFASDPMIAKPIQMAWDAKGRLWIAGSRIYPQIEPGKTETDQILIVEDTDRDGAADTRSVFAEGLLIPTGVLPDASGGAYIANSTELLHMTDTDGDGRADSERVVLSGFGTEDTHHILHGLRWAPGGQLMMMQSIYIHSHIETPHGPRRMLAGGVWEFKPKTMELDAYNHGLVNSWGLRWTRHGQTFQTDGAGGNGINYTFPGTLMQTARGAPKIMPGLNPGQPKHCGLEIVSGRGVPQDWQDRFLTADFRGNRVNSFVVERDDAAGWISTKAEDLITSTSVAFRPVDISQGPDGAVYIADWYNPIIQHGEVDFRDERRDRVHGRIWRISRTSKEALPLPSLDTPQQQFAALESPEAWTRDMARLKLRETGPKISRMLEAWRPQSGPLKLEKLWVHQGLDLVNESLLADLLSHENADIRAAATRVLKAWVNRLPEALAHLEQLVNDPDPLVRQEALHVARAHGSVEAVRLALEVAGHPKNRFIDFSLWRTLYDLQDVWVPAMTERPESFGGVPQMLTAMETIGKPIALPGLVKRWQAEELNPEQTRQVLGLVGKLGNPNQLKLVFEQALHTKDVEHLNVLTAAAKRARPAGDLERIHRLIDHSDARTSQAALKLAGAWKLPSVQPKLVAASNMPGQGMWIAFEALAQFGPSGREALMEAATAKESSPRRCAAVWALCQVDPRSGAEQTAALLADAKAGENVLPAIDALLRHKAGPPALARALDGKTIDPAVAGACARRLGGRRVPALAKALQESGNLKPVITALKDAELDAFLADVESSGDAVRGEAVYHRTALQCTRCHAIAGAGGLIGPDLTSIGASAPVDYLVESMLDPSAKIKEGYHTVMLSTKDDKVVLGTVVREGEKDMVLRDAVGTEVTVTIADIAKKQIVPQSLMPLGLTAQLRRDEFVDLIAFLGKLGKTGGLVVPREANVRSWTFLQGGKAVNDDVRHKGWPHIAEANPQFNWQPVYSRVDGSLPIYPDLQTGRFGGIGTGSAFFLSFEIVVDAPGPVTFTTADAKGLKLLYGGETLDMTPRTTIDVKGSGVQRVFVAVEERVRKGKPVNIVLASTLESPARIRLR